jgi:hypothetical protein
VTELHEVESLLNARVPFRLRHAVDLQPVSDVVDDRHMRKDGIGLEHHVHGALVGRDVAHVLTVDQNMAFARHLETGKHAQQGGLAAARRPEKCEELPWHDVKADIVHRDRRPPSLGDVAKADNRLNGALGGIS